MVVELSKHPMDRIKAWTHGCTSWAYNYLVMTALLNSLNWLLPEGVWQLLWNRVLNFFGHDEFMLYVVGTNVLTISLYWSLGSIYLLADITGRPQWLRKYKVQTGTHEPIDRKRLMAALRQVLFNQFLVALPMSVVAFPLAQLGGIPSLQELPTLNEVMRDMVVFLLIEEVVAYYTHRLFHHRLFYKRFHKKHHEWTAPVALAAIYCHPLEHAISNLIPPSLGPGLMKSHLVTTWLWYTVMVIITLSDHSGYHLPFAPSPEAHDYHHLKFNQYYGTLGIMDYIHGTDETYRESQQFRRHIVSCTLKPVRVAVPDLPKRK